MNKNTLLAEFILLDKIKSKLDSTIKYIFKSDKNIIEYSYIDNGTGKDIICVPSQTMCSLGCKLCHLTDKIGLMPTINLSHTTTLNHIEHIYNDLNLGSRPLLISFMGAGEPLLNYDEVLITMEMLNSRYDNIRFGLATMLPKAKWLDFMKFTEQVVRKKLNIKLHLSLHHANQEDRNEWMPNALDIQSSIVALNFYNRVTGNPIEVHYTLMKGVNDSSEEIIKLCDLFNGIDKDNFTLKFMRYSEKETLATERVSLELEIHKILEKCRIIFNLTAEYYEPPGLDIGASCGQFLIDKD